MRIIFNNFNISFVFNLGLNTSIIQLVSCVNILYEYNEQLLFNNLFLVIRLTLITILISKNK
ncbi:hypothetical protein NSMS1_09170 [Nostoc sp. MS1]|nr:hypothetical protein NSMS1_09170 [Nostoc sp. MS1]